MGFENVTWVHAVILIVAAVVGSKVVDTVATRWFRVANDRAEAGKVTAEASQIYASATETMIQIMQATITAQEARIQRLEEQVGLLQANLAEYVRLHGPLKL